MTGQKLPYLILILFAKDRAGDIEQFTTAGDHPPQSIQQAPLLTHKTFNIFASAQPLYIRMAPYDAGRAARHVQQDTIDRVAVLPGFKLRRVGGAQIRFETKPVQVICYTGKPLGLMIQSR